jgi:(p)ppGpp synthase/HD superfamily hydrolase
MGLVQKAYDYANRFHLGQKRHSGEAYINHPVQVSQILAEMKLDIPSIITGILHDVVEDTEVTINMILETFGQRVAEMVNRLTRDRPDGTKLSVKEIIRMAYKNGDKEVLLIKIFDRLHNLQNIHFLTADKQIKVAK